MIIEGLVCFVSMIALDFVWARYTRKVTNNERFKASAYASLIMCFNGIVTIGYTHEPWMLLPAVAGAFLGTYLGMI